MEITINDEFFYKLVEEVIKRLKTKEENKSEKWLTAKEAMSKLKIKSKGTLYKLKDEGSIECTQFGKKSIRYNAHSIEKFLESKIQKPFDD